MYGVMAGQRQRQRQPDQQRGTREERANNAGERDEKSAAHGMTRNILQYFQKRLNPPPEEECEEACARHRPEAPGALAATTRFSTHEIKLMYRGFKQECPSGVVDEQAFKHIFSQFFPLGDASQYAHFVFNTIKHKQSGKINFEELLGIASRVARGSLQEKMAWVFSLYDTDGDGRISRHEMQQVVCAIYELLGRGAVPPPSSAAARAHTDIIFNQMDVNADGVVTPEELARWCARSPAALRSLAALDTVL